MQMSRGGGTYSLGTVTHSSKVRRVVDLLLAELERVRKQPIAGPELEQARTRVLSRFVKSLAPKHAVFYALIELDNYEISEGSLATYRSQTRAITAEDLMQHAQRLLHPDRAAIILVGSAEKLLPQLAGLGPVEVVQVPPVLETAPAIDDLPPAAGENPPDDDERPAKAG
jgi:zinc protease